MQYTNLSWRNGQPFSDKFDDIYYSSNNGETISGEHEFNHVFFKHNGLPERWQEGENFTIAELGFGSGLNFLLTVREWLKYQSETGQKACLHYVAIEKYPLAPEAISQLISRYPELKVFCDELLNQYPPAVGASHSRHLFDSRVLVHFKFMDVLTALENERLNIDAWYLDGFSPSKNRDMWSEQLFLKIAQNSRANATCSTYTAAGAVKRSMKNAGFLVDKVDGYGSKREMLTGNYKANNEQQTNSYGFKESPWFLSDNENKHYKNNKAVIIGAGIAGLSVAYALYRRGWKITIIDKHGDVAKETSSNPAAIVYPRLAVNNDIENDFFISSFCFSVALMRTLQSNSAETFWYETGLLQKTEKEKALALLTKYQFNEEFISLYDNNEAKNDLLINDSDDLFSAYLEYKTAGVVLPEVLCDFLKNECGDSLNIISGTVDQIRFEKSQWHCFAENDLISSSEVLVVANGASLEGINLPVDFPVEKVRGQTVDLRENTLSKNMKSALASTVTLSPSIAGKHHLGSSYSRDNVSRKVDESQTDELIKSLNMQYPYEFSQSDCVEEWVGFRATSLDRMPIVGSVPDISYFNNEYADICHGKTNKTYPAAKNMKGLYVSLAHGSRGFTSAFLSAEIICAHILGEPEPIQKRVIDCVSPSRFIVNDLKRRRT